MTYYNQATLDETKISKNVQDKAHLYQLLLLHLKDRIRICNK